MRALGAGPRARRAGAPDHAALRRLRCTLARGRDGPAPLRRRPSTLADPAEWRAADGAGLRSGCGSAGPEFGW